MASKNDESTNTKLCTRIGNVFGLFIVCMCLFVCFFNSNRHFIDLNQMHSEYYYSRNDFIDLSTHFNVNEYICHMNSLLMHTQSVSCCLFSLLFFFFLIFLFFFFVVVFFSSIFQYAIAFHSRFMVPCTFSHGRLHYTEKYQSFSSLMVIHIYTLLSLTHKLSKIISVQLVRSNQYHIVSFVCIHNIHKFSFTLHQ